MNISFYRKKAIRAINNLQYGEQTNAFLLSVNILKLQ